MTKRDKQDNDQSTPGSPDLGKLATEYMDLWQKQLSSMAADKDVAALMAQSVELMNTGAGTIASNMAKMATHQASTENPGDDSTQSERTASTCPACGVDEHAVEHLTRRVERLEEQLAALAATPGKSGT
jgi:hypothetical protein